MDRLSFHYQTQRGEIAIGRIFAICCIQAAAEVCSVSGVSVSCSEVTEGI